MTVTRPLRAAVFLRRLNRFGALVHMDGREVLAHLPNSGRLGELLTPGRPVLLALPSRPSASGHRGQPDSPTGRQEAVGPRDAGVGLGRHPGRRTAADLVFMLGPNGWVSVDARLPGRLLAEAVGAGKLAAFRGDRVVRLEYRPDFAPHSRLDVLLDGPDGPAVVETKSVTLVVDGVGRFPDAPTLRGQRHLQTLMQAAGRGQRAYVVFVVQRPDARQFGPHRQADPAFARALSQAAEGGVHVRAYACRVQPPSIEIERELPVVLDG